ncbi:MAG: metal ABC transporter substrate-binding protein [Candidatus Promineifilaceae bacterium]
MARRTALKATCLGLIGCAGLLSACQSAPAANDGRLRVVASVSPLTNIVHNIGGERIQLSGIVPEGVNSHTFEPAPSDAVLLAAADLIFMNGLNLELPTLDLAEANLKDGAEIVLLGDAAASPAEYVYDFSFPRAAGNPNPHLWTDPIYALEYAATVRDKLSARDAEGAGHYEANYTTFAGRIAQLDAAIQRTTASIPAENRLLLTYHDSFAYFAPRYGYTVVGAIQPADFSEPSAQEVAGLIEQLRAQGVPALFGSEVFPSPVLEQIGREAGVRYVASLRDDDLPGEPGEEKHSYLGLMVYDVQIMAEALGGDPGLMEGVDVTNIPGPDIGVAQPQ